MTITTDLYSKAGQVEYRATAFRYRPVDDPDDVGQSDDGWVWDGEMIQRGRHPDYDDYAEDHRHRRDLDSLEAALDWIRDVAGTGHDGNARIVEMEWVEDVFEDPVTGQTVRTAEDRPVREWWWEPDRGAGEYLSDPVSTA